ncbi:prepilin-type N-terminal cleavage/methylation domain-containing protein [Saccharophagus degradans]|uniref:type II secretion system protein n=1 Tax=Saccharophagus degradans TaxID=86304 RepID=UPI0024781AE4|nr:prepilin-type N-terminal cleavage/methylation domain-containing protein [Saccharophagus degradans]WGO97424.1 prepilin-type N-terminal cleavage/methylation domain-containing protein [Saccharophagus degradans]
MKHAKFTFEGTCKQRGFSLFELLLVIVIISLLIYLGYDKYSPQMANAAEKMIEYQASTFSRAVSTINAQSKIDNKGYVEYGGDKNSRIYVNEFGWPANTNRTMSPKYYNQTPEECKQLWDMIFKNAPSSAIGYIDQKNKPDFKISSINARICRYELVRKQEGTYFFDYDLSTGNIVVSHP